MVKKYKIKDNRIEDICKDLKKIKTYQKLKKFLEDEIGFTNECILDRDLGRN